MPVLIETVDEIMAREQRDMLFIQFEPLFADGDGDRSSSAQERHFAWFAANGLSYELAAPRGWLEGDPGLYAVYFEGPNDPRVAAYASAFEDADGRSLAPDEYQMVILSYEAWLRRGAEEGDAPSPADW